MNLGPPIGILIVPEGKGSRIDCPFDPRADRVTTQEELKRLLALRAQPTDVDGYHLLHTKWFTQAVH